jgi:LacI family transcriptional regulator
MCVVGFDDIGAAAHSRPALTTVRQPLRLKGYAAARLLLDAPDRRSTSRAGTVPGGGPDELDLPVELVVRRSSAEAR